MMCARGMLLLCIVLVSGCGYGVIDIEKTREAMRKHAEYTYFEGQKDYLNGDIRIKYVEADRCYVWTKSPWDSGKQPIYDPSVIKGGR